MWQATPGTFGSSNALTQTRSLRPISLNVVSTQERSSARATSAKEAIASATNSTSNARCMGFPFLMAVVGLPRERAMRKQAKPTCLASQRTRPASRSDWQRLLSPTPWWQHLISALASSRLSYFEQALLGKHSPSLVSLHPGDRVDTPVRSDGVRGLARGVCW